MVNQIQSNLYNTTTFGTTQKWSSWKDGRGAQGGAILEN